MKTIAPLSMLLMVLPLFAQIHKNPSGIDTLPNGFARLAQPDTAEPSIDIHRPYSKLVLDPFLRKKAGSKPSQYAHLIMRPIVDSSHFVKLVEQTGMTVISQYPVKRNGRVYEEWIVNTGRLGYAHVQKALESDYGVYFFNMWPFDYDDKISAKMKGLREFTASEKSPSTNQVFGSVDFFSDVPVSRRKEILLQYLQPYHTRGITYWRGFRHDFQIVANLDEVRRVEEQDTGVYVTNDKSRALMRLSNIQSVPTNVVAPKTNWLDTGIYQNQYYGRGIEVGIYDTGIDRTGQTNSSFIGDFWERDASNIARLRLSGPDSLWDPMGTNLYDEIRLHGTHVAGIVGGNGWRSFNSGAPSRYLWRGMAPKVTFHSRYSTDSLSNGHVNNHSHSISWDTTYVANCALVDSLARRRDTTHTIVYSAGNNGIQNNRFGGGGYGFQQGYYSILADTKNAIVVGASFHDTALRAPFSSMGPTRDGRIKPDIMAPGASMDWPDRSVNPMYIEIDSLYFKRQNGTKVKVFNFNSLEGWQMEFGLTSLTANSGRLLASQNFISGHLKNDSVTGYTTNSTDSLIIRYKITHTSQIPSKMTSLRCGLSWNQTGVLGFDSVQFSLPTPGGSVWQTKRLRLSNLRGKIDPTDLSIGTARWPSTSTVITKLGLTFRSDTSSAILSASAIDSIRKDYPDYVSIEGTSMAAPAATGVIALLLEKWKKVLFPTANLHTQGPWNSTMKAILIHTATDMVKFAPSPVEKGSGPAGQPVNDIGAINVNPDICNFYRDSVKHPDGSISWPNPRCLAQLADNSWDKYGFGPDYSTGYGLINAERAMGMIDASKSSRIRQESISQNQTHVYTFDVPSNTTKFRITVAWDDLPGNPAQPIWDAKLVNDLDLMVEDPYGNVFLPYSLYPVPQASVVYSNNAPPADGIDPVTHADIPTYAPTGENHVDNVEVVDVGGGNGSLTVGKWKIIVKGYNVMSGQTQGYSLVSDFTNRKVNSSIGWIRNNRYCPEGEPTIIFDDEDDAPNATASYFRSTSSGTMNPTGTTGTNFENWGGTIHWICREAMDTLPRYRFDYAVYQLSGTCPINSYPFQIQIDNENTANANWNSGDIAPSFQSGDNSTLYFCFVPNNGSTTTPPWWYKKRGAFTTVNSSHNNCPSYNWHIEDDEDSAPDNTYVFPSGTTTYATRIKALFNWTGGNTQPDMHYLWNGCP